MAEMKLNRNICDNIISSELRRSVELGKGAAQDWQYKGQSESSTYYESREDIRLTRRASRIIQSRSHRRHGAYERALLQTSRCHSAVTTSGGPSILKP